jgi:DNA polymerase-1
VPWHTPTGQGSTEAQYLEAIRHEHEAVGVIIEAMSFSVLQRSFTSALPGKINPVTGRVHPSLWPMGTSTGRFSCSDPNLQNVPKKIGDDSPVNIRDAFVSRPGWTLVDCDYSQIELMIATWLSGEPMWWRAYVNGEDVHRNTAIKVYGVDDPTDKQRDDGKEGNYKLLYGQGARNFGRKYGMTLEKAEQFVDAWIAAVPRFAVWREKVKMDARRTGKAHTHFGRERPMDGIFSDDRKTAGEWERRAVSHTVQGTAADLMKMAIVRVHKALSERPSLPAAMLLQIHDELLFEVRDDAIEEATELIRDRMTIVLDGFVPLKVDVKTGKTWGSCK